MSAESSHPYRSSATPSHVGSASDDPFARAFFAARVFLFAWAAARAIVGATCGMDFESYLAIVIAIAATRRA